MYYVVDVKRTSTGSRKTMIQFPFISSNGVKFHKITLFTQPLCCKQWFHKTIKRFVFFLHGLLEFKEFCLEKLHTDIEIKILYSISSTALKKYLGFLWFKTLNFTYVFHPQPIGLATICTRKINQHCKVKTV